ncbi:MAG: carboxypeptidase-like regulatory domain-containing protein [Bacteroidales bacterium]|nr:carboxypeptidase-like regulatory domain-containing protein [Bacteroidales bacterium]MBQ6689135.1 carboxypeptidase-like regulatory domain-containing protein [Bacteroidales bacterium]
MKKLILIISMALASSLAFAQEHTRQTHITDGSKTLYLIDGVLSLKTAADELPSDAIKNMNIVTGIEKVVIITTKNGRVISGRVVDTEGKPMIGVAVLSPKTHNGVVTDMDGRFQMSLPAGEAFLTFKMIDYPSKTVQVDKSDLGDIVMDKNATQDVVVISARGEKMQAGDPLCIIKKPDGEISKGSFDSITPEQIKSIHVFKDNQVDLYKKFGDTSNGVILIELK